jgi:hypothetical protein
LLLVAVVLLGMALLWLLGMELELHWEEVTGSGSDGVGDLCMWCENKLWSI